MARRDDLAAPSAPEPPDLHSTWPARSQAFWELFAMAFGSADANHNLAAGRISDFAQKLSADDVRRLANHFGNRYYHEIARVRGFGLKRADSIRRQLDQLKKKAGGRGAADDYIMMAAAYVASHGSEADRQRAKTIWDQVQALPQGGRHAGPMASVDRDNRAPVTAAAAISADLRHYLRILQSRLDRVELPASWGTVDFSLSNVFVPPPLDMIRAARSFDDAGVATLRNTPDERLELGVRIVSERRVTLIGAVGTGKGALLRGIALAYVARSLGDSESWSRWSDPFGLQEIDYVPIFIDLRDVAAPPEPDADWGTIVTEALKPMATMLGPGREAVAAALADRVRRQLPLLVLLDGLDERPAAVCRGFVRLADQMRTDSRNVALVYSARWRPEQVLEADLHAEIFEVTRLPPNMAEELIARYFLAAGVERGREAAKDALARFAASDLWRDVVGNPLELLQFAPDIASPGADLQSGPVDPTSQRLRALLRRRESTRALTDEPCWEWPIGHVALHMVNSGLQQIDSLTLAGELQRAYDHLRARHPHCGLLRSPDYTYDRYAKLMVECGLLRLRVEGGPLTAGQPSQYDFFSDQVRDWLYASCISGGWSPSSDGALGDFIDSDTRTVRPDRRDQLLQLIGVAEPRSAMDRIDELIGQDEDSSLAIVLQAMRRGRGPSASRSALLIERIVDRVDSSSPAYYRELLAAFAAEFGPPDRIPAPWGIISGLWLNLPTVRQSDFSAIVQRGWLSVETYVDQTLGRIGGMDGADACAAMFEVLEFAFSVSPYKLDEPEGAALDRVVHTVATNLARGGMRAVFAAWSLSWIFNAREDQLPWIEAEVPNRAALLDLLRDERAPTLGRSAAAHLLLWKTRSHRDLATDWALALDSGRAFGTSLPPLPQPDPEVRDAAEKVAALASSEWARRQFALFALEAGSKDRAIIADAAKYATEPLFSFGSTRAIRALAGAPDSDRARALAGIATHNARSGAALEAMLGLLATCSRDSVYAVWEDMRYEWSPAQLATMERLLFPE